MPQRELIFALMGTGFTAGGKRIGMRMSREEYPEGPAEP